MFLKDFAKATFILVEEVKSKLQGLPTFSDSVHPPVISSKLKSIVAKAQKITLSWRDSYTTTDHFILAYWELNFSPFKEWKNQLSLSKKQVESALKDR